MGVVGFADGARLMLEGETPPGGHLEKHRHTLVGTEGMMIARTEGEATSMLKPGEAPDDPVGLRIHRMDGRVESFEFPGDTYQNARRREIDTFARWVAGDVDGHAQDAHVCIRTQEILMAIYESARTHSLVELPMKTQPSIRERLLPLPSKSIASLLPVMFSITVSTITASESSQCTPSKISRICVRRTSSTASTPSIALSGMSASRQSVTSRRDSVGAIQPS